MSPDGWMALILAASAVCVAGLVVYAARLDRNGGHAHRNIVRLSADDTPGPVGTGRLEPFPDDDPADTTGIQPPATRYLGKEIGQYVDELFAKHAGGES